MTEIVKMTIPIDGQWHDLEHPIEVDDHSVHMSVTGKEIYLFTREFEDERTTQVTVIKDGSKLDGTFWLVGTVRHLNTFYHLVTRYKKVEQPEPVKKKWFWQK